MSAQIGKLFGAALAGSGLTMVYMQLTAAPPPEVEAAMPADVKNSRLKKTLSSAGLYPAPDVAKVGARLKTQATGSMAAFSSGASGAVLTKGGGDAM